MQVSHSLRVLYDQCTWYNIIQLCIHTQLSNIKLYTGLFEMIDGVLTTCHIKYT